LLGVAEDITERKKDQERIAHLAHYDALTDLPNRAAFTKHLGSTIEQAAANNQMFAVLCLDLVVGNADAHLRERRAMPRDLEAAVTKGEITLYYQPQMQIGSAITGFRTGWKSKSPKTC
jgi:sensor c-di-GMP phosphodiesterase-like protein